MSEPIEVGKRVAVIGCPGSGKSTLAAKLATQTGLPVFFLDETYHDNSRWSRDRAEKRQQWQAYQEELVKSPTWIIDGNYKRTLEIRLAAADTIIFLDYSRWLCLTRALRRSLVWYIGKKQSVAGGNPGRADWWFLRFIWSYRTVERPKVLGLLQVYGSGKQVYVLTTPKQAEDFY